MPARLILTLTLIALVAATATRAQAPTPTAEHKRLAYFVGTWQGENDMKASPFGPAGKMTSKEACQWFEGGFHMVCRTEMSGVMGAMKGMGILSYDSAQKSYVYYGIDSMGTNDTGRGTLSGQTWTWTSEGRTPDGQPVKSRYVMTIASPTAYTMVWESSIAGGAWTRIMEGKNTKVK